MDDGAGRKTTYNHCVRVDGPSGWRERRSPNLVEIRNQVDSPRVILGQIKAALLIFAESAQSRISSVRGGHFHTQPVRVLPFQAPDLTRDKIPKNINA